MTGSLTPTPESAQLSESSRPSLRLLISITAVQTIGWLAYYSQAQMYRPVMNAFDKGEGAIGFLWSVEIGAMVIAMGLAAGPLTRWSRVKVAVVGSLIFIVGNCASAFIATLETELLCAGTSNFHLLMASRILVAAGGGMMASAATAAAASAPHPERIFAITLITYSLLSSLESPLLPMVFIPYGAAGGFLFLAAAALLLMPFYFWLLPPKTTEKQEAEKENVWLSLRSAPNRKLALTAMAALFIYEIGQGGVDKLTGLIGEEAGLDQMAVGWVFFWGANIGLLGALLPTWLGDRYGYLRPLVVGVVLNVATGVCFVFCESGTEFAIVYTAWSTAYYFVTPYFFAAMARLDHLGRWVVTMEAAWTAGDAIAPWISGELVEFGGYLYIGGLVLVTGVFGLVGLVSVGRRLDAKSSSAEGTTATSR